jgi:hypothetical protein
MTYIAHLTHSPAAGRVLAIATATGWTGLGTGNGDAAVQVYGYDYLTYEGYEELPGFVVNGTWYRGRGRFVLATADGSRRFAVVQADAGAGMLHDYAVAEF